MEIKIEIEEEVEKLKDFTKDIDHLIEKASEDIFSEISLLDQMDDPILSLRYINEPCHYMGTRFIDRACENLKKKKPRLTI